MLRTRMGWESMMNTSQSYVQSNQTRLSKENDVLTPGGGGEGTSAYDP